MPNEALKESQGFGGPKYCPSEKRKKKEHICFCLNFYYCIFDGIQIPGTVDGGKVPHAKTEARDYALANPYI